MNLSMETIMTADIQCECVYNLYIRTSIYKFYSKLQFKEKWNKCYNIVWLQMNESIELKILPKLPATHIVNY